MMGQMRMYRDLEAKNREILSLRERILNCELLVERTESKCLTLQVQHAQETKKLQTHVLELKDEAKGIELKFYKARAEMVESHSSEVAKLQTDASEDIQDLQLQIEEKKEELEAEYTQVFAEYKSRAERDLIEKQILTRENKRLVEENRLLVARQAESGGAVTPETALGKRKRQSSETSHTSHVRDESPSPQSPRLPRSDVIPQVGGGGGRGLVYTTQWAGRATATDTDLVNTTPNADEYARKNWYAFTTVDGMRAVVFGAEPENQRLALEIANTHTDIEKVTFFLGASQREMRMKQAGDEIKVTPRVIPERWQWKMNAGKPGAPEPTGE